MVQLLSVVMQQYLQYIQYCLKTSCIKYGYQLPQRRITGRSYHDVSSPQHILKIMPKFKITMFKNGAMEKNNQ